jgi:hypothetical protein
MKTLDAISAFDALAKLSQSGESLPLRFAYAAAKNRRRLAEFVEVYEKKRRELIDQFGKKDEKGALEVNEGNFLLADPEGFTAAYKVLNDEDVPLDLHKVALADFPATIGLDVMNNLQPMVLED